jgi:Ca2+-binding EF-hand superfamily protein
VHAAKIPPLQKSATSRSRLAVIVSTTSTPSEIQIPNSHTVDFDSFSKILNRPNGFRDPGEPEEYCRGFQVFDKDMTGFIGVGQLRYILTNLGEKMSDEEVDELLKGVNVDTSSGEVNYVELVRTILAN